MTIAYSNIPNTFPLDLSTLKLTHEQFYKLCIANPEQPLELTAAGILIFMSPVGGESGKREADLLVDLGIWNRQTQLGAVFSSSTIFKLPLGSQRSPDVAWVALSRWNALTNEDRQKFPPLAPDFVVELRSRTDNLSELQAKMVEYRDNGVRLGLLINPQDRQVEIYRIGAEVEVLQSPTSINCDDVLPGFKLSLANIF
ncbi:Uma2 family endonuclease [Chamaesiphon sp. GL140_3_metabinner_50]|uniref:Uma2 family endonuclease n=1 Tax=Chamaesiphon sp. GL140_3_metabinner_50 TaxID=2970812 RepID=UPI0025E62334|nr:Uma2 family endonuclease [Chamaesiphon sp. GL140_3_metabinner_50]